MTRATFTHTGVIVAVLLAASVQTIAAIEPMTDYPGPYCETSRSGCCDQREDNCAVPISTTLCYCDEFCDRSTNGDCCPDYESFCLGMVPPPEPITELSCTLHGQRFAQFDGPVRDNCNLCTCDRFGALHCDTDLCLLDDALLRNVNQLSYSIGWTPHNYTQFWGRKYADGLRLRLGTMEPTRKVKAMSKLSSREQPQLPRAFNAREKWGGEMISAVRDQGWCGSSWAVSTASVASDRFAVESKGQETVVLSPQQLLSCVRRQQGCSGGHLDWAWNYFRKVGIVDDECFPYIAGTNRCKVHHSDTLSDVGCRQTTNVPRRSLYKMGPAYALRNETDIMIEIQSSGPVQATMRVYRDFFTYRSGIYRHTSASRAEPTGFHSVRLLGWGEEYSDDDRTVTKYWIAANSWGTWWGEDGLFRILRGSNECEIENYVLASWADVTTQKLSGGRGHSSAAQPLLQSRKSHQYHRKQHHQRRENNI